MKWKVWLHILKAIVMEDDLLLQDEKRLESALEWFVKILSKNRGGKIESLSGFVG